MLLLNLKTASVNCQSYIYGFLIFVFSDDMIVHLSNILMLLHNFFGIEIMLEKYFKAANKATTWCFQIW